MAVSLVYGVVSYLLFLLFTYVYILVLYLKSGLLLLSQMVSRYVSALMDEIFNDAFSLSVRFNLTCVMNKISYDCCLISLGLFYER